MEVEVLRSIYGRAIYYHGSGREDKQPVSQPVLYEMKLQQSETKIVFTIPEKYPDVLLSISVTQDNQPVYTELESLLFNVAHESCGEVMIYNLIEEAKEWIKKLKLD
ncbi:hypothetical protein OS493_017837 [Desmophyllum pertusum]|uniref:RWD domain-containing protein n=1 Tax=Desmophyllum pertusum TaxID=174260 RepID=A0A9X0CRA6_9CNID|nr:hypothetical protein OS493_017837 [Desmophyllum pertusum]